MTTESPAGDIGQPIPNSNLAVISLVAGILGISLFPFLGSIVAVITGVMARREIQESAGTLGGDGLATAGLVLGWIGIGMGVLGFCAAGAFLAISLCAALFAAGEGASSLLPFLLAVI